MTGESRERLRLARALAESWRVDARVQAVAVGGSVAAGVADVDSDIDLFVFWSPRPEPAPHDLTDEHEFRIDQTAVEGVPVEISHFARKRLDDVFARVLDGGDADPQLQNLVHAVSTALPLVDRGFLAAYAARAARYPDALAQAMVWRGLDFTPRWYLRVLAGRHDLLRFHDRLSHDLRCLLTALLGINRLYQPHPEFKSLALVLARLTLAPPALEERLGALFGAEPRDAAALLEELIAELWPLIRAHVPALDVAACRRVYEAPRSNSEHTAC